MAQLWWIFFYGKYNYRFDTLQISSFQHKCIFLNCLHFDTFGRYIYLFNIILAVFSCVLCWKCWVPLHWYYGDFSALNSVFLHMLVFYIDNIRNVYLAANQYIIMISEGSCDSEDWSNDAKNSALIYWNNFHFNIFSHRKLNISKYYCFTVLFIIEMQP